MKKFIKQITAIGAGVVMLGSTLGGAVAADLSNLPSPFVSNSAYSDTAFVVGAKAGTNDDAARTTLTGYFNPYVDSAAGGIASSSKTEKIYFGEGINGSFAATLDDGKVSSLLDGNINFRGKSYRVEEQIITSDVGNISYVTTSGLTGEEELGLDPVMYTNTNEGAWAYRYRFSKDFTSNISSDYELGITFLGKNLRISDVTSATKDSVTFTTGTQASVKQDSSLSSGGYTINIGTIFEGSVEVSINSETPKFISSGAEEVFYIGDDMVSVKVDTIGYTTDAESRTALITYGKDISVTVEDGDPVQEELGMPDVDDRLLDAEWQWDISVTTSDIFTSGDYIGIKWNQRIDRYDDDPAPIRPGEYWATPYNYITMDMDVLEPSYVEYQFEFNDRFSVRNESASSDYAVISISAPSRSGRNDGIDIAGTETDWVVVNASGYTWYYDNDGYWQPGGWANSTEYGEGLTLEPSSDTRRSVVFYNADGIVANLTETIAYMKIEDVIATDENALTGSYIQANMSIANKRLGSTTSTEVGDLYYYRFATPFGSATLEPVESWEEGLLTAYGIKVTGSDGSGRIDSATASNRLYIWLPEEEVYSEVTFNARTSAAAVDPVLTTEAGAANYNNLVLVGGPCVNTLTATYMGVPANSCGDASGIELNKGVVKLVEQGGKTALIVAGWERADTQRAATTVSAGGLSGAEITV